MINIFFSGIANLPLFKLCTKIIKRQRRQNEKADQLHRKIPGLSSLHNQYKCHLFRAETT